MKLYLMLDTISHVLDKVVGWLCIGFAAVMTVSTLIGILFRYVMVNPLPWTEETARYAMIWMGLLAVSMGVKRDAHLGLNFVMELLPVWMQMIFKYIVRLLTGVFLYYLMIYGYKMAAGGMSQIAPALRIKMVYVLGAVPLAAGLSLVQLVLITLIDWVNREDKCRYF